MKLAAVTFQNLFPAINVQTTRLSACQVRMPQGSAGRHAGALHASCRARTEQSS